MVTKPAPSIFRISLPEKIMNTLLHDCTFSRGSQNLSGTPQSFWLSGLIFCLLLTAGICAQTPTTEDDLLDRSLEDLTQIEVTSVSKKEEKLFQTAAAVYVITQEDIRRSGMTSIPELLRLVPGMNVAQIDGSRWAIGSRGFSGRFSNKLLVLVDGRSVYNLSFGGVYWEHLDQMLEDIERIEVIRAARADNRPSVPSTMGHEVATNPFLRCDDAAFRGRVALDSALSGVEMFAEVRKLRNEF